MRILIANGNNRFHLSSLADQLHSAGFSVCFVTAGYVKDSGMGRILMRMTRASRRFGRLIDRREKGLADGCVEPVWRSEFWSVAAALLRERLRRIEWVRMAERRAVMALRKGLLDVCARRDYQFDLLHIRSAYGGEVMKAARLKGVRTIADHSMVAPGLYQTLVDKNGCLEQAARAYSLPQTGIDKLMLDDCRDAERIVVNSTFARTTMELAPKFEPRKLAVVPVGVDERFGAAIGPRSRRGGPKRAVFVGRFSIEKGARILMGALPSFKKLGIQLDIIGSATVGAPLTMEAIRSGVVFRGLLSRDELAQVLPRDYDIFVFPSLAEGAARVVFEAMACGLPVICTENSGSVIVDKVGGWLMEECSGQALSKALTQAWLDHPRWEAMGDFNKRSIETDFTQKHYGERMVALYKSYEW